jgi:hypothetical protein
MNSLRQFEPHRKCGIRANFGSATVGKCELGGGT